MPVSLSWPGAEPVIAAAPDGTLYVEGVGAAALAANRTSNVNKVFRSIDRGITWQDVTPPFLGQERSNDGFLAVAPGGTVYASNVFSLTFQLYRSGDRGDTWQRLDVPAVPPLMHRHWVVPVAPATLHVTVESLPAQAVAEIFGGLTPPTDVQADHGMWYLRSDDGGTTWGTPQRIDGQMNLAGQGTMAVHGDALYVVRYAEEPNAMHNTYDDGSWYLLASDDGGTTWEHRPMFDLDGELAAAIVSLAVDANGSLFVAWAQARDDGVSRIRLAASADGGRTWRHVAEPVATTGQTHAMPFLAAHGTRVELVSYVADALGSASRLDVPWHVDRWSVDPATLVAADWIRLTDAPVHHGNVCAKGPACGPGEDRRLLDYAWLTFLPDGCLAAAFASTEWDQPSAFAVAAVQDRGPGCHATI